MDSHSFNYWMSQGHYAPQQPVHTGLYDVPPDTSKVPSLSGSPESSTYDQFPAPVHQTYYPHIVDKATHFGSYRLPMTPSEFGSDHGSPYCSPRAVPHTESVYMTGSITLPAEKTHTTSGRRRAQNRAAQRAFRERKEKHARDLEAQLSVMTERYNRLEVSHAELNAAYEKLRKTVELLTEDGGVDEGEDGISNAGSRKSSNSDTLRKVLDILHGEIDGARTVKPESI
ncbi:hypothetical protein B5807_07463 [Epicoccum nigrum]|uniref:BZIP domain-containing protein n=1 Tax=Epicoccum nigrum TaxID=105696 RepID=A0A1Y2LV48_EPING|nr:hypothetical protein B5807_07463 [Epicoccum nigrum]